MKRKYYKLVQFENEIQPRLVSHDNLHKQVFDLNLIRLLIIQRGSGTALLDLNNFQSDKNEQQQQNQQFSHQQLPSIFKISQPQKIIEILNLVTPFGTYQKKPYSIYLFGFLIRVIQEERLAIIAIVQNLSMNKKNEHLVDFWMKYFFCQVESEFTPKLLRADIPSYEITNPERFLHYQRIFQIYSQMSLDQMLENFNNYMKRQLTSVLPYSKARYLLSRLMIIDSESRQIILNHSFVKDTARHIEFLNSKNFRKFFTTFEKIAIKQHQQKQSIMHNAHRRSFLSNYNNRTYNKDTLQELSFGAFIFKIQDFKTPQEHNYRIGLIFEKNLKRKQMLNKKIFARLQRKLNRKQEELNNRNDKYLQVVDFFRFMFDFKRSHPFSQFQNKQQLNDIKTKARILMSGGGVNSHFYFNGSQLQQRRKFGSEMTVIIKKENKLFGSLNMNKDSSKDQTGTRVSNIQSQFSVQNQKQKQDHNSKGAQSEKIDNLEQSSSHSSSSSSSSSSSDSESSKSDNGYIQNHLSDANDALSSLTMNLMQNTGLLMHQISKDFISLDDRKSVVYGVSLRALINNNQQEQSESLEVSNPVSDEINEDNDMNEYKHSLYDMVNDTVVTISSIKEFDRERDWLAQQVVIDSSESEGQKTILDLASNIQVGIPNSPSQISLHAFSQRPSTKLHDDSPNLLNVPQSKRPSIRVTGLNEISKQAKPRRHSMRMMSRSSLGGSGIPNPSTFHNQKLLQVMSDGVSPANASSKNKKRGSFRLRNNNFDLGSYAESPKLFGIGGIIEKVKEESEEDGDEIKEREKA